MSLTSILDHGIVHKSETINSRNIDDPQTSNSLYSSNVETAGFYRLKIKEPDPVVFAYPSAPEVIQHVPVTANMNDTCTFHTTANKCLNAVEGDLGEMGAFNAEDGLDSW